MSARDIGSLVRNNSLLSDIFGEWPSFHDAEVLELRLDRNGPGGVELEAKVHLFETTSEVTPEGFHRLQNHTLATLLFTGVDGLSLDGFNHQNVLFGLSLVDISDRQLDQLRWEVAFDSSHGVAARFLCETVAVVTAEPFTLAQPTASPRGTRSAPRRLG